MTVNANYALTENVQGYVYLGHHYSLVEKNQDKEIQRRIMAGWTGRAAYAKHIFEYNDMHVLGPHVLMLLIVTFLANISQIHAYRHTNARGCSVQYR